MLFGALEAGGTKMVCAIGNEQGEILERIGLNCEYLGVEQAKGSIPVSSVFPKIFERKNSVNVTI